MSSKDSLLTTTNPSLATHIRVLVSESDATALAEYNNALAGKHDISVVGQANSEQDTFELVKSQDADVLLFDNEMNRSNAMATLTHIRKLAPRLGIIMMLAPNQSLVLSQVLEAGANAYCSKDVQPSRLGTAIRSVFQGDYWLDADIATTLMKQAPYQPVDTIDAAHQLQDNLSQRELDVLRLIVQGGTNQEIADKLVISLATAKAHVRSILSKLSVEDRTQAAVVAMRKHLV